MPPAVVIVHAVNVGYPGYANPAVADVLSRSLIPQLFAAVARRQATPEEAVAGAKEQIEVIFRSWRARRRI